MNRDPAAPETLASAESAPLPPAPLNTSGLPDDPAVLKQMIAELIRELRRTRRDKEALEQRLDALLRRLHGPRPDPVNPNQLLLFANEGEAPPAPPIDLPPEDEEKKRKKKKRHRHGRSRPPKHLRHEEKVYTLTQAELLCPDCNAERTPIGFETTKQLDYKPAEVIVIEHKRTKYACKCCEGNVAIAPKPPQPVDRGLPGPGLLAQIAVDKYQDHLPLYRMESRFARLGLKLPRSTTCDWMAALAGMLTPLYHVLVAMVLQSKVLHTDDTTVPVQDHQRISMRTGRLWVYLGDPDHPGVVFDYTRTHARDGPAAFLKEFQGFLQADAYGAYDGIFAGSGGAIVEVACWAHARNKFKDAQGTDPERALAAKAWIRKLYDVEDKAKEEIARAQLTGAAAAAVRLRLRQELSVPLLESFRKWLAAQKAEVLPKSPIAVAINYVMNQWDALNRYVTDGDLDIDNNVSERTLKLIGIGRQNWLFVGSDQGGDTAAVIFSFTATCKRLNIDTFAYLRDVIERLPTHPADRLDELLPHRWQAAQLAQQSEPTPDPA